MNHFALYLSNNVDKTQLLDNIFENNFPLENIELKDKKGELFSNLSIAKIIDEEVRHDYYPITTPENKSLGSMSSGQQRRALLNYQLNKKPYFIVLDDIYASADIETCEYFREAIQQKQHEILFIQLVFRHSDILPFINKVGIVNNELTPVNWESKDEFLNIESDKTQKFQSDFPENFTPKFNTSDILIQLQNVTASYGEKKVLHQVSWTIRKGEFWQLKGPNGSGKSTLLAMIIGDNPRGYGQDITLFGKKKGSGETIWDLKKQIGYFTPNITLLFTHNDTAENMLISGLVDSVGLYTKPSDMQRRIADQWIAILGPEFRRKRYNNLSSGQQRMLMVARAMVKQPPLLILDEPTAGLDEENARLFINLIHAIAAKKQVAIIYVSHRTEPDLKPDFTFNLTPTPQGSEGKVISDLKI